MNKLRAVIDTNVSVSGLLFGGQPLKVVKAALAKKFIWVISPQLLEELDRVLASKKFGLSKVEVVALTEPLFEVIEIVVPTTRFDVITRCPGDNRVLECGVDGKCDVITTGDRRDLLSLQAFQGIEIIKVRDFLERLGSQ